MWAGLDPRLDDPSARDFFVGLTVARSFAGDGQAT